MCYCHSLHVNHLEYVNDTPCRGWHVNRFNLTNKKFGPNILSLNKKRVKFCRGKVRRSRWWVCPYSIFHIQYSKNSYSIFNIPYSIFHHPYSIFHISYSRQGEEIPMVGPPIFLTQFQKTIVVSI